MIAHDLRSPLTATQVSLETMLAKDSDSLAASALAPHITLHSTVGNDAGLFGYRRILEVLVNLISNAIKFSETILKLPSTARKNARAN